MNSKQNIYQSNRFIDKWSPELEPLGFSNVPNCLMTCQAELGITSPEFNVLMQIMSYRFTPKNPYASMVKIAKRMNKDPKTVRAAVRSLERKRLIRRIFVTGEANTFDFAPLVHKLESHKCTNPLQKRIPPYQKMNNPHLTKTYTKKDRSHKRKEIRNSKPNHIGEIMADRLIASIPALRNDVQ